MYENFNDSRRSYGMDSDLIQIRLNSILRNTYLWMMIGLIITSGISYALTYFLPTVPSLRVLFSPGVSIGLIVAQFILVFALSASVTRMNSGTSITLFLLYSALTGISLTPIFFVYTQASIALAFGVAAITFGVTSIYGFITKTDLSKMGNILLMALFGLIIAMLINIFLRSSMMDFVISCVGVILFTGLTAYDTQKIKQLAIQLEGKADDNLSTNVSVIGALTLYLDFLNMFLFLLRIFGSSNSRD